MGSVVVVVLHDARKASLRVEEMYGGILLTGTLGYLLNAGFVRLERRALAWHRGLQGHLATG